LSVDQVVSAGDVDALAFLEDLLFDFFRDVEIVVLIPFFVLVVVEIAIVVAAVSRPLVNEEGVQFVRSPVDLPVGLFYLLVDLRYLGLVLVYPLPNFVLILFQELHKLGLYAFGQLGEVEGIVNFVFPF